MLSCIIDVYGSRSRSIAELVVRSTVCLMINGSVPLLSVKRVHSSHPRVNIESMD